MIDLSANDAYNLIKEKKDVIILDVRTKEEFNDGHLADAKSFPLGRIDMDLDELYGYEDRPILVYCERGGRSFQASEVLENNGFNNIYNMLGGYTSWVNASFNKNNRG